jgi:hypothetical protein
MSVVELSISFIFSELVPKRNRFFICVYENNNSTKIAKQNMAPRAKAVLVRLGLFISAKINAYLLLYITLRGCCDSSNGTIGNTLIREIGFLTVDALLMLKNFSKRQFRSEPRSKDLTITTYRIKYRPSNLRSK